MSRQSNLLPLEQGTHNRKSVVSVDINISFLAILKSSLVTVVSVGGNISVSVFSFKCVCVCITLVHNSICSYKG